MDRGGCSNITDILLQIIERFDSPCGSAWDRRMRRRSRSKIRMKSNRCSITGVGSIGIEEGAVGEAVGG